MRGRQGEPNVGIHSSLREFMGLASAGIVDSIIAVVIFNSCSYKENNKCGGSMTS